MNNSKNKWLVVLLGPTGVGKTDLSISLAQYFNAEIFSCDSRQMYRELKIGTAAPGPQQLKAIKHHFIGNLSITDYYNASKFEVETLALLDVYFKTHQIAIMTGGSGLYIDAVVKGIDDLPSVKPEVRKKYLKLFESDGIEALQKKVEQIDPEFYKITDIKNAKRLLKALEVFDMTGKPYSSFRTQPNKKRPFNILQIGINRPRPELYERINKRVDIMLEQGLVDEARQFYEYKHLNSLNTVGYKELMGYFDGNYDIDEAIRLIKRNSRRYAKRQITWWNRDNSIVWFEPEKLTEIFNYIKVRTKSS